MKKVIFLEAPDLILKNVYKTHQEFMKKFSKQAGFNHFVYSLERAVDQVVELWWEDKNQYDQKINQLQARILELEKRFHLNPENSHKPPSTSGFKKIKNSRVKTGKKIGAQKGHEGVIPDMDPEPDQVHRHEPQKCRSCGKSLIKVEEYKVDKRQVVDLKDGVKYVTEYQRVSKFCPDCGDFTRADLPADVFWLKAKKTFGPILKSVALYFMGYQLIPVARTQEILNDVFGVSVSQGSLCNFLRNISKDLIDWELSLKSQLIQSKVLNADETTMRYDKKNDWVHVVSNEGLTLLSHHESRGQEAQNVIGVLPEYKGHLVHDGFKAYDLYTNCSHSYCNAHILRELKYLHEEDKQEWAVDFSNLLKTTLHEVHENGETHLKEVKKEYHRILKKGFAEAGYANEIKGRPPDGFKKVWDQGKTIKVPTFKRRKLSRAMNLLIRLRDSFKEIMGFALDKKVPFTNNQAERDLRMLKVKGKISGCFRGKQAFKDFLRLRSFFSTIKKQTLPLLESLYVLQVLEV